MKLAKGDKVAIVCCSNGQSLSKKKEIENLKVILEEMGLISVFSKYIYQKISLEEVENNLKGFPESGSPLEKARELMEFYEPPSGGFSLRRGVCKQRPDQARCQQHFYHHPV